MNWETFYCPHRDCRYYGKPCTAGLLGRMAAAEGTAGPLQRVWGSVALSSGTGMMDSKPTERYSRLLYARERKAMSCIQRLGRASGQRYDRARRRSCRTPLPCGHTLLRAPPARVGVATRRVMEFRPYQGSASTWCQALWLGLGGRVGVGGVCAGMAHGVSFRDRQA